MAIAFLNNVTIDGYLDIGKNELRNARIDNLTTTEINAIASPVAGQIAYDSTVNKLKFYNGTAWGSIDSGSGTVTSVGITAGAGVAVSGSPITTSGSITVGVDGVLEDLDTLGAPTADGQFIVATAAGAFAYESGATARTSLGLGTAATAASGDFLAKSNNLSDITSLSEAKTNLELGALADLSSVNASTIADNSVNIAELNVTDGTSGQVLTTNGAGTLSFTSKTTNTDTDVSVGNLTSRLSEITSNVTIGDAEDVTVTTAGNFAVTGNALITGDLTVNGSTTTVNSTTVTVDDPIITLGGDTAPTVDDNKDRGVEFRWHNGTVAKAGFFGYDDSTGYFTFIPDATNTSEVFSGTQGTIDVANIRLDDSGLILNGTAVSATAAELNYVDGVTSNIQTQLNAKQATITGAATTIDDADLTASRALVSDASGKVAVSAVTSTELGYLDGVTSAVQTQLDGKQATITGAATTIDDANLTASRALVSNASGKVGVSAVTSTELGYLDGVTSAIQTQFSTKTKRYTTEVTTVGGSASIAQSTHGMAADEIPIVQVFNESKTQVFPEIDFDGSGNLTISVNSNATFTVMMVGLG